MLHYEKPDSVVKAIRDVIDNLKKRTPMSQVIMLLLFPIGLYFYFFKERKARPAYEKVFSDFNNDIRDDDELSQSDKIQRYKDMLRKNAYEIIEATDTSVTGEKKIFSMSLFAMSVGLYYVGAVVYLLYFYTMQNPHRVVFDTQGGK